MIPIKRDNINDYIADFPTTTQVLLEQMRITIKQAAPEAEEIISYAMPAFKLNDNLVYFAGYKNHIGFYPGANAIKVFEKELASYKSAKGSVQFPITQPLPIEIVSEIVKFRVEENLQKAAKKKTLKNK